MTVRLGSEHRRVRDGAAGERAGPARDDARRSATPSTESTERLDDSAGRRADGRRPQRRAGVVGAGRAWRRRALSRGLPVRTAPSRRRRRRSRSSLAADLGNAFSMGRIAPADYRKRATALLGESAALSVRRRRLRLLARAASSATSISRATCCTSCTSADALGIAPDADVVADALDFLERELKQPAPPRQVQWLPAWSRDGGVRREGADRARAQSGLEHHAPVRHGRPAAGLRR